MAKLEELIKKGKERKRLTGQLQKVLAEVAETMAEALDEGASVSMVGYKIAVKAYRSNVGTYKTLVVKEADSSGEYWTRGAITAMGEPGEDRYLHGDFHTVVHVADREDFLFFANCLDKIIDGFGAEQDKIIETLKTWRSTTRRRQWAGWCLGVLGSG